MKTSIIITGFSGTYGMNKDAGNRFYSIDEVIKHLQSKEFNHDLDHIEVEICDEHNNVVLRLIDFDKYLNLLKQHENYVEWVNTHCD